MLFDEERFFTALSGFLLLRAQRLLSLQLATGNSQLLFEGRVRDLGRRTKDVSSKLTASLLAREA
jgi:hypothetical protein